MVGEQVLYRSMYWMRVGYIEVEKDKQFTIDFGAGLHHVGNKKDCTVLPSLGRPYTIIEAIHYWRSGVSPKSI